MRGVEVWPPLLGLGTPAAEALERDLGAAPRAVVAAHLDALAREPEPSAAHRTSLLAGRFALALRSADDPAGAERLAVTTAAAFRDAGDAESAAWIDVERATLLSSRRERLDDAIALANALHDQHDDHGHGHDIGHDNGRALAAASLRAVGAVARAKGDLRTSLASLERSVAVAEASGSVREIVRSLNTLGTSYASLGAGPLARDALERAREIAELSSQRASSAIASGQLAVLALDDGRHALAVRHLQAQRTLAAHLGDTHGEARALALLVEAHALAEQPAEAREAAAASRALYASAPTPWTLLQARMATLYEAEEAFEAGDVERAEARVASCDATSDALEGRLVRGRASFCTLWRALRGPTVDPRPVLDLAFAALRRVPRPSWVERLLALAVRLCIARALPALAEALAARAAWLGEARARASAANLVPLRRGFPELALARATARGGDLVRCAKLALAPVTPFDAHVVVASALALPSSFDDDTFVLREGRRTIVLVATHAADADALVLLANASSAAVGRAAGSVFADVELAGDITFEGPAVEAARVRRA